MPGSYTINASGLTSGGQDCITIASSASGTSLDCQHYSITGTSQSGNGIHLSSTSGVTIYNCDVSNFYHGIYLTSSTGNAITGNTATSNGYGISLYSSTNNSFMGNTATGSTRGSDFYCYSQEANNDLGNTCNDHDSCNWVTTCP